MLPLDRPEPGITAIAYDLDERNPGLPSSRKLAADTSGPSVVGQIAKGTATMMMNQVTGGVAQDVVRNAGNTVINSTGGESKDSPRDVLLLDSGLDFDVFVEEPV